MMVHSDERTAPLIEEWVESLVSSEGLERGLRVFADWAQDLNPLEREIVRMKAIPAVHWCLSLAPERDRLETAKRLVDSALEVTDSTE